MTGSSSFPFLSFVIDTIGVHGERRQECQGGQILG